MSASDASATGGGVTVSCGVTPAGAVASQLPVRGDLVEPVDVTQVLTVGLFDGIGGLRVAADALGWNVVGHVAVESSDSAARVVESRFPSTIRVSDVKLVCPEMVRSWALKFAQASVILSGAGPPCQGVSGSKKGALKDARSSLFQFVGPIRTTINETVSSKIRNHEKRLVQKLCTQVSLKGDDLLLQAASEDNVRYHRLTASIPAKLWKWRTIASWQWKGSREHINALEMRAVLTSLRWRLEKKQVLNLCTWLTHSSVSTR